MKFFWRRYIHRLRLQKKVRIIGDFRIQTHISSKVPAYIVATGSQLTVASEGPLVRILFDFFLASETFQSKMPTKATETEKSRYSKDYHTISIALISSIKVQRPRRLLRTTWSKHRCCSFVLNLDAPKSAVYNYKYWYSNSKKSKLSTWLLSRPYSVAS